MSKTWTAEEVKFLFDNPTLSYQELSFCMGRTKESIRDKWRRKLNGAQRPNSSLKNAWTQEEDQVLLDNYGVKTHKQISELVGRSWQAVSQRLMHLGVAEGKYGTSWTEEELEILETLAGKVSWQSIADQLGKSWGSVQSMAWPARRKEVLERDNYTCQHPGCGLYSPSGSKFQIHHIVRRKLILSDDMRWLVTLCVPHHMQQSAHWWTDFTPDMLELLPEYQQFIYNGGNI